MIRRARAAGLPVIADPASSGDYKIYSGATAVTPNRLETSRATDIEVESIEDARNAGQALCEKLNLEYAFGDDRFRRQCCGSANDGSWAHHPTRKREVYDITGAGDMVLAMIGVGAAAGYSPDDLAKLANVARVDWKSNKLVWSPSNETKSSAIYCREIVVRVVKSSSYLN